MRPQPIEVAERLVEVERTDIATEWIRRRAVLLPSGAIITALGQNTWAFRQAAYRWLRERGRL